MTEPVKKLRARIKPATEPITQESPAPPTASTIPEIKVEVIPSAVESTGLDSNKPQLKKRRVGPNTSASPTLEPPSAIQIPDIDVTRISASSSGNLSSNDRLGSKGSIEMSGSDLSGFCKESSDINVYKLPLENFGETELKRYVNSSQIQRLRNEILEKLDNDEAQYLKTYSPSSQTMEKSTSFDKISSSMNNLATASSKNIMSMAQGFMAAMKSVDESKVTIPPVFFRASTDEISQPYMSSIDQLYQDILGDSDGVSLAQKQSFLNAGFLSVDSNNSDPETDILADIQNAFDKCKIPISGNSYKVDFQTKETLDLLYLISSFLITGLKYSAKEFFTMFMAEANYATQSSPNIVPLEKCLIETSKKMYPIDSDIQYMALVIHNMLLQSSLSSMMTFLSTLMRFKKQLYYDDAWVVSPEVCIRSSYIFETIESCQMISVVPHGRLPQHITLSPQRFVSRIRGSVRDYLSTLRICYSLGTPISETQKLPLNNTMKQLINSILLQKDGSYAKPDALWDLFIASASKPINHPAYPVYAQIIEENKSGFKSSIKRAVNVITQCISKNVLPYLLIFLQPAFNTQKSLQRSTVLSHTPSVIEISYELLRLSSISYEIGKAEVAKLFE